MVLGRRGGGKYLIGHVPRWHLFDVENLSALNINSNEKYFGDIPICLLA